MAVHAGVRRDRDDGAHGRGQLLKPAGARTRRPGRRGQHRRALSGSRLCRDWAAPPAAVLFSQSSSGQAHSLSRRHRHCRVRRRGGRLGATGGRASPDCGQEQRPAPPGRRLARGPDGHVTGDQLGRGGNSRHRSGRTPLGARRTYKPGGRPERCCRRPAGHCRRPGRLRDLGRRHLCARHRHRHAPPRGRLAVPDPRRGGGDPGRSFARVRRWDGGAETRESSVLSPTAPFSRPVRYPRRAPTPPR